VRQFDVGDFVYFQQKPNDTLDNSFGHTILKIKAIKPIGVFELQGADERHAFPGSSLRGGVHENFISTSSCALYIYASFFC
jgi:hypothetical protein